MPPDCTTISSAPAIRLIPVWHWSAKRWGSLFALPRPHLTMRTQTSTLSHFRPLSTAQSLLSTGKTLLIIRCSAFFWKSFKRRLFIRTQKRAQKSRHTRPMCDGFSVIQIFLFTGCAPGRRRGWPRASRPVHHSRHRWRPAWCRPSSSCSCSPCSRCSGPPPWSGR